MRRGRTCWCGRHTTAADQFLKIAQHSPVRAGGALSEEMQPHLAGVPIFQCTPRRLMSGRPRSPARRARATFLWRGLTLAAPLSRPEYQ